MEEKRHFLKYSLGAVSCPDQKSAKSLIFTQNILIDNYNHK